MIFYGKHCQITVHLDNDTNGFYENGDYLIGESLFSPLNNRINYHRSRQIERSVVCCRERKTRFLENLMLKTL